MLRIIFQTILGILFPAGGAYIGYLFIKTLETNGNPLLLLASLVLIGIGVFFLVCAGKSDKSVVTKPTVVPAGTVNESAGGMIDRNNELASQWSKTVEARDRLKMLEISSSVTSTPES